MVGGHYGGLMLITVDNPEIIEVSVTHSPGQLAPAVSARLMPDRANVLDVSAWTDYTPPELTIAVNGVEWVCAPRDVSAAADPAQGVFLDVQFYPLLMELLQNVGYSKHVVFLSCPQWQADLLLDDEEGEYNPDEYEVYHKPCDPWISTGWTVNDIIQKIVAIYNDHAGQAEPKITLTSTLPTLHVQNATVIFEKGTAYFEFITSLLPSDFTYTWNFYNGTLQLALAQPATAAFTIPAGFTTLAASRAAVPDYTMIEATAGKYKIVNGLSLGTPANPRTQGGSIVPYTDEEETEEIQGATPPNPLVRYSPGETVVRTRRIGPDGEFFALLLETREIRGPLLTNLGAETGVGVIARERHTYTYENQDTLTFQVPRVTQKVTQRSGYAYQYHNSYQAVSNGVAYHLSSAGDVLTQWQYDAASPKPTILASAVSVWQDNIEIVTDAKTYTHDTDASKDWPEGTERTNTITTQRLGYWLSTGNAAVIQKTGKTRLFADAQESPATVFGMVADWLNNGTNATITAAVPATQATDTQARELRLISPRTYAYVETRRTFDASTGQTKTQTQANMIDSKSLPACPTQYRLTPLRATILNQDAGRYSGPQAGNVIPLKITIPTNNPKDAETWWALAFWQKTHPARTLTLQSFDKYVPVGGRIAGGTVTGVAVSVSNDRQQSVTLTII